MNSNLNLGQLDQNQSQSSDHNYRRNRRQYESHVPNDSHYSSDQFNRYSNYGNQYSNGQNRCPQWTEPQPFGYFDGQPFVANELQNNYQSFPNNNESNRGTKRSGHKPRNQFQANHSYRPNNDNYYQTNGVNSPNVEEPLQNPSNSYSDQLQDNYQSFPNDSINSKKRSANRHRKPQNFQNNQNYGSKMGHSSGDRHRNAEQVLQNPSNSSVDEIQTNRQMKEDIRRDKPLKEKVRRNIEHKYDRNWRSDPQRSCGQRSDQKVDKNENNSRDYSSYSESKVIEENKNKSKQMAVSDESQREIMEELLRKGEFECMVCCDQIRVRERIWSCQHCFNIFHIKCIKTWANSQSAKSGTEDQSWRCPTCQTNHSKIPSVYYCFCGKYRDPELNRYLVPHTCGETCGRKRKSDPKLKYNCEHKCLLLCHPGSCPPCEMKVSRECGCGQTRITVSCAANDEDVICNKVCNKALNCGQHFCQRVCHSDKCEDCSVTKMQTCFCGQNRKVVECNVENNLIDNFCCEKKCNKSLKCGNHICEQICHFGDCGDCPLVTESVTHCSCGKTPLSDLSHTKRQSCLDPIPNCNQICDKELICGSEKEHHRCRNKCHSGVCSPCNQKTVIRCRCGANSDNIDCIQFAQKESNTFICKKRCKKKKLCGRHKCLNECCIDGEHRCQQICGKKLSCGQHSCEELCHSGTCPQCWNVSWDELTCWCGSELKLPPIACGTKRPECGRICSRTHPCNHPISHNCHDDDRCPPCTYFAPKTCFGGHERRPVPCHETSFSCGYLCGHPLDCGLHECQMICHFGECNECTLPCTKTRVDCEHLCGLKCHQKTSPELCPKTNCKIMVKISCDCGRKGDQMPCFKVNDENALRLSLNSLANQRLKKGESVDVTQILKNMKEFKYIQLKCDEKCAVVERNRLLAEALDVRDADFNPDPGPPKYTELLKSTARTDPNFIKDIYEKLSKLVIDSKQSKLSFKTLNFPPMNSENRHIIHELSEHFGCKTHAVDREPNRSVIVKAVKDKCYLPTVSLIDFVKEESESRKTVRNKSNKITLKSHCFDTGSDDSTLKSINTGLSSLSIIRNISNDSNASKNVDYFDFKGD